jgi:23S rRNA A1618 N6-methylase RlmF
MKKIFKRFVRITLLTILAGVLTTATIVLFPQQLIAKKICYKKFTIYSNENVDDNIKTVLDNASVLVKKSELYDSDYEYNIILCNNSFYNKIDDILLGVGRTARATLKNVIIKVKIDPKQDLALPTFHKACEEKLTIVIAHEMIHCLQASKYGILKFSPFKHPEFWKLEGYPEYISKQNELASKNYNLTSDVDRYLNLEVKQRIFGFRQKKVDVKFRIIITKAS